MIMLGIWTDPGAPVVPRPKSAQHLAAQMQGRRSLTEAPPRAMIATPRGAVASAVSLLSRLTRKSTSN